MRRRLLTAPLRERRGLTLVELMISLAILMIIFAAVFSTVLTSTRAYSSISSEIKLQTESQTCSAFISEKLIDCSDAIYFDAAASCLYAFSGAADGEPVIHRFRLSDGKLLYSECGVVKVGEARSITPGPESTVSSRVTSFSAAVTSSEGEASSVALDISYRYQKRSYDGSYTLSLRNSPLAPASLDALLTLLYP